MRTWRLAHTGALIDVWRNLAGDENAALRLQLAAVTDARVKPLLVEILVVGSSDRLHRPIRSADGSGGQDSAGRTSGVQEISPHHAL